MNENINYLKNYDSVSDDVKFAANSIIRLRILAALFEKSQNMKELTNLTKLSYIQNSRHEGLHDENNKKLQCFILSNLVFCRITTPSDFPNEKH